MPALQNLYHASSCLGVCIIFLIAFSPIVAEGLHPNRAFYILYSLSRFLLSLRKDCIQTEHLGHLVEGRKEEESHGCDAGVDPGQNDSDDALLVSNV